MKKIIQPFLFLTLFLPYKMRAQIISTEQKEDKKAGKTIEAIKKKVAKRQAGDGQTELYLNGSWCNSYRILDRISTSSYDGVLNRKDETKLNVMSFEMGFCSKVHPNILFSAGLGLLRNGEQYAFKGADTSFTYKTEYEYFTVPVRIQYVRGTVIRFMAGGSIFPQFLSSFSQNRVSVNSKSQKVDYTARDQSYMNTMLLSLGLNAGVQWRMSDLFSVSVLPEYRWQLTNTYMPLRGTSHNARVFSVNFALIYHI